MTTTSELVTRCYYYSFLGGTQLVNECHWCQFPLLSPKPNFIMTTRIMMVLMVVLVAMVLGVMVVADINARWLARCRDHC